MRTTVRYLIVVVIFLCGSVFVPVTRAAEDIGASDIAATQAWEMLPGESLRSLAALFYPHSRHMQQRFVAATQSLNSAQLGVVGPDRIFEQAVTIRIPELHAFSMQSSGRTVTEAAKPRHKTMREPAKVGNSKPARAKVDSGDADYAAVAELNQARKSELAALQQRLKSLEEQSSAMQQAFPTKETHSVDGSTPKPLKRLMEADTAKPENAWLEWWPLLPVAVLFAAGFVALRWYRARSRRAVAHSEPVISDAENALQEPVGSASGGQRFFPPDAGSFASRARSSFSVNEIESVVDEAKVIVALGRTDNAIRLLLEHIDADPRRSVSPWLYLLELYRATGNQPAFTEFSQRMHKVFNVVVPAWERDAPVMVVPSSIEELSHLMQKIQEMWGTPECLAFLNDLLQDNRAGERIGLSMAVFEEIVLLVTVLEIRLKTF